MMPQVCELLPVSGSEAFGAVPGPLWPRPPPPRTQLGCCPSRAEVAAAALLHVAQCAAGRTRRRGSERRGLCRKRIRAAAASLFGGAPSRLRSPLTRRGHSPRPTDAVVPRDAIPLDKRRKSARHWAAESGRGRKTDSSHANVAAVAPLIPVSRPSFHWVPPGMRSIHPHKWHLYSTYIYG